MSGNNEYDPGYVRERLSEMIDRGADIRTPRKKAQDRFNLDRTDWMINLFNSDDAGAMPRLEDYVAEEMKRAAGGEGSMRENYNAGNRGLPNRTQPPAGQPISDKKSIFYDKDADAKYQAMMRDAEFQAMMAREQNATISNYRGEPVARESPTYLNAMSPEQSAKYAEITAQLKPRMERDAYIEAARPYVKAAGNAIGGLAGAAVTRHPAGAVALAGAGNAAADSIADAVDTALGMPNHNTRKEVAMNALYNLGEGAAYEAGGQLGTGALKNMNLLPSHYLNVKNPGIGLYDRIPVTEAEHVYRGLPRAEIPSNNMFKQIVAKEVKDDLGRTVNVPRIGVKHAADSAIERGLGKEGHSAEHLSILKDMDKVYPNSRHLESVPDTTPRTSKAGVPQTGTVNYRIAPVKTGDKVYTTKFTEKDLGNGRSVYDQSLHKILPDGNAKDMTVFDMLYGVGKSEKAGGGLYVEPRFYPAVGGLIQTVANMLEINPYSKEKK